MTATVTKSTRKSIHQRVADIIDPEDKEIVDEINQLRAEREEDERQIQLIPINQLERHPKNRTIDPQDPSILTLAESIRDNGQLDPLRVRQIGRDRYQIISGERRYTAIKVHLDQAWRARCIVVNIDDAAALREVAVANSNRQDLNPIQRAELMQDLMKPKDKGGSGLSLVEAGALFGLTSESGCKNAMRLLKLPTAIREQLVSGDLPERYARALVPYAHVDVLMNEVVKSLTSKGYERQVMLAAFIDDDIPQWMTSEIERNGRPISPDIEHYHRWPIGQRMPCLFDWQPHEAKLQIVELPTVVSTDHKTNKDVIEPRKWALNTKLWDKLQEPLAKKRVEEGKSKQKGSKPAKAKPEKKLTPKEQAALDKKRAAEADKRLDNFTKEWACRMIRCTLASLSNQDVLVCRTLPWLLSHCGQSEIREAHADAMIECQVTTKRTREPLDMLAKVNGDDAYDVLCAMWRIILWPVTRLVGDTAKQSTLTPAGQLPDKLIALGYHSEWKNLQTLLAMTKVSMETAWQAGTVDDSDERRLISVWLCRHTKAQLQALTMQLPTGGLPPASWNSRDLLAEHILAAHKPGKPLPLPKRLGAIK